LRQVFFNFYGEKVCVQSCWSELIVLLEKDFSVFKVDSLEHNDNKILNLKIINGNPGEIVIPEMVSKMQSLNSITYQNEQIRYNDYYGKLLSVFNYQKETAELISLDLDKTHEIAYLLILSRVGKSLDVRRLHKLHAFAVSYKKIAFVCMMPMKGGKSTLLLELLKHEGVKMISDDIPLIDHAGKIYPFPIKIGIDGIWEKSISISDAEENVYHLKREQYGLKTFVCLIGLRDKVELPGNSFNKVIIAEGFRFNSEKINILHSSMLVTFRGLLKHGVVGIGLPMILEYFWEFGWRDFILKTKIFFFRVYGFWVLALRSKRIQIQLGRNVENNAIEILKFMETI
jgi:hypothetical protein